MLKQYKFLSFDYLFDHTFNVYRKQQSSLLIVSERIGWLKRAKRFKVAISRIHTHVRRSPMWTLLDLLRQKRTKFSTRKKFIQILAWSVFSAIGLSFHIFSVANVSQLVMNNVKVLRWLSSYQVCIVSMLKD